MFIFLSVMVSLLSAIFGVLSAILGVLSAILGLLSAMFAALSAILTLLSAMPHFLSTKLSSSTERFYLNFMKKAISAYMQKSLLLYLIESNRL
ncbi:hypothetical protein [Lysinibacillus sp. NPDC092081]|uniref:hypothetical protein n=1 Tax=Lysinibacillus sp. NPDC092081 TaxID=3364131 RepID=UPI003824A48E